MFSNSNIELLEKILQHHKISMTVQKHIKHPVMCWFCSVALANIFMPVFYLVFWISTGCQLFGWVG